MALVDMIFIPPLKMGWVACWQIGELLNTFLKPRPKNFSQKLGWWLNQKKLNKVETLRIGNKNEKDKMVFG